MELLLILIFVVVYFYYFSASAKGRRGESEVASILSQLPNSEYSVINDITIQNNNKSAQIDHVIISVYGIFVIETKNYSGWIMGGEKSDQWIKNMYGHKYYFYNPIKQNYGHISALANTLLISKNNFISIVAFPYEADIKVHTDEHLIYFGEIIPIIFSYTTKIFSVSEVDKMTKQLLSLQLNSKEQKKEHIQYARDKKNFSKSALYQGICPYCGSPLKVRCGKYGVFIGCSQYPKCKYTHPV
ncbi:MAG: NERD domain-containing protein [Alphaproteobacteria bacterium]|nr:NERD domain-containing protein [Alphaproteobacteria bacterium]